MNFKSQTNLDVADNSGARRVMCMLETCFGGSKRRYATVGDIIGVSIKEAIPRGNHTKGDVMWTINRSLAEATCMTLLSMGAIPAASNTDLTYRLYRTSAAHSTRSCSRRADLPGTRFGLSANCGERNRKRRSSSCITAGCHSRPRKRSRPRDHRSVALAGNTQTPAPSHRARTGLTEIRDGRGTRIYRACRHPRTHCGGRPRLRPRGGDVARGDRVPGSQCAVGLMRPWPRSRRRPPTSRSSTGRFRGWMASSSPGASARSQAAPQKCESSL